MFRGITWWRLVFLHPRHPTSISSESRLAASFILSVLLLMRSFRVASSFLSLFCVRLTLECHFGAFASWSSTASSFQFTDLLHGECSFVASLLLLLFLFHPVCFFFILLSPVTFTSLSSLCLCLLYDVLFWINFYFRCISGSAIKLGWKGAFVIPTRRARENAETT